MISVSELSVRFGRTAALDGVNLTIDKGECTLLAGPNGSGKTTLLRAIAGVLFYKNGRVSIERQEVGTRTREKTAYIPASLSMYDGLRLKDAVKLHKSFFPAFSYRGIADFVLDMNQYVQSLSRGEKTLFFLTLALSTSPDYLLIDDVIHFLDPHLREIFLSTLLQLIEEEQLSVIIAAQSPVDLEGILERVVVMDKGKVALDETVEDLKQSCVRLYTEIPPPDLPVIFKKEWEGMKELYIYPFEPHMKPEGRLEHLNLAEILRAFIGGEYGIR